MGKPRKHAELIKAWADGAEVQVRYPNLDLDNWSNEPDPVWADALEYRIKPEPPQICITQLHFTTSLPLCHPQLAVTIDGSDWVRASMLEKVAEAVRAELVAQVARYSTGCSTYINGETDLAAIIAKVKEGK